MEQGGYAGEDNLEILVGAKNYNKFLVDQIILYSHGAESALDFGSGIGTFSTAVKNSGSRVVCVEPDIKLYNRLKGLHLEVVSDLDQVPDDSVDYIFSLNVLEHISDDLNALKELYRRLRPGGRLFLYVPAFNILFSSMDRKVGHFRRYRRPRLRALVIEAGFKPERSFYVDSLGFFASLVFKIFGNSAGDLNPSLVRLYDGLIFPLSRIIDRVIGGSFGKNLLIVARR